MTDAEATTKAAADDDLQSQYEQAVECAAAGDADEAQQLYEQLQQAELSGRIGALVENDLAALAALEGRWEDALAGFRRSLEIDPECSAAAQNLDLLLGEDDAAESPEEVEIPGEQPTPREDTGDASTEHAAAPPRVKVAILSFLFNWPSTGGGIVHTVELNDFLARAGYEVRHIVARNLEWGVGRADHPLPYEPEVLQFDAAHWNAADIQARFREAVGRFDPDYVIITDSWNTKPLLAEAVSGYPYYLRLQASECLCPLNNLRLLPGWKRCPNHQLASAERCRECVEQWNPRSGKFHRAERELAGVGTDAYDRTLRKAFAEAAGVLVVDPISEALVGPYCRAVHVIPSGFDAARFPWPWEQEPPRLAEPTTLLMAGVVEDPIKGFDVLHEACEKLWARRQDFALRATGNPARRVDAFTEFLGWRSQQELPRILRAADIVVLPPVGAEALGRTAVEAMAVGRPVVASRNGGLPATVSDGAGLLFEPGNADDLAEKIEMLLDDANLRETLGALGRRRFEKHFTWDAVIQRSYRPLLAPIRAETEE